MATSLNPYISKFDAGFDVGKSSQYRMTIQFSLGGFSYALLDVPSNMLIGMECYQSDALADSNDVFQALERALESKELNNKTFHSVVCLIDNRVCTLVPAPLFDAREASTYLDFSFQAMDGQIVLHEELKTEKCVNVFAMPKTLRNRIAAKWEKARITHFSTVFVDAALRYAPEGKAAFVNVKSRSFDLAIVDNGHLVFFNNFKFNTKADFAYFLLFALEQNQFSPLDMPVCFSGLILSDSEIIELCSRYVRYLLFIENRNEIRVSEALDEIPFQYYYIHYQALK